MESEFIDPKANLDEAEEQEEAECSGQRNELPRVLQESDPVPEEVVVDVPQVEDDEHDDDQVDEASVSLRGGLSRKDRYVSHLAGRKGEAALVLPCREVPLDLTDALLGRFQGQYLSGYGFVATLSLFVNQFAFSWG